jgi:cytochrome c-type biogenesis protein CcmH/NrfF
MEIVFLWLWPIFVLCTLTAFAFYVTRRDRKTHD